MYLMKWKFRTVLIYLMHNYLPSLHNTFYKIKYAKYIITLPAKPKQARLVLPLTTYNDEFISFK